MEDEPITFETAKLAKEKGFNEECRFNVFRGTKDYITKEKSINSKLSSTTYSQPTQTKLQRWLREVHDIHISLNYEIEGYSCTIGGYDQINHNHVGVELEEQYNTYEQTLEAGILVALKLIKEKKYDRI